MNIHDTLPDLDSIVFESLGDPVEFEGRAIFGIYAEDYEGVELGQWRSGLTEPMLQLRSVDMTGIARNKKIAVRGKQYTIVDLHPQGDFTTWLVLRDDGPNRG